MQKMLNVKTLNVLLVFSIATATVAQAGVKEIFGQIAGGILGGALCNEIGIGKGSGRTAAIALCAVGGSMIGGEIGRDMDEADARAFEESQRRSWDGELNRDYEWDGSRHGSRTGIRGKIRPINHGYHSRTREVCREYQSVTYRGNRSQETKSIMCRRSDGSFYTLEERSLFINGRLVERETNEREGNTSNLPYFTPGNRVPAPRPVPYPNDNRYDRGDRDSRYDSYERCDGWDLNQARRGDFVYVRSGDAYTFKNVNIYGRDVTVSVGRREYSLRIDQIGIEGCHYGMRTGSRVETRFGRGVVVGIFFNGELAVDLGRRVVIINRTEIYHGR